VSPVALADKAVRLDGAVARYHRQLAEVQGVMAQHAGLFQQAILARRFRKEIDAARGLDPRDAQALRDLLEFYILAPGVVVAISGRRSLLRGRSALTLDRGRAGAYCILATVYAGKADWSALEAIFSSAVQALPGDATPYYRAAERLLSDANEPSRAERYLRVYLTQETEGDEPTAADAHWKLGHALRAQGQEANAVREWQTALKLDPESAARELKRTRKHERR